MIYCETFIYLFPKLVVLFSVVHTGNREFCCPHCTQRFGRKDHMTRHAKKTHAQLFDGGGGGLEQRHHRRLASTPSLGGDPLVSSSGTAASSRKERSVSDPGPALSAAAMNSCYGGNLGSAVVFSAGGMMRPLLSPTGVLSDFQKLGCATPTPLYQLSSNARLPPLDALYSSPSSCLRGSMIAEGDSGSGGGSGDIFLDDEHSLSQLPVARGSVSRLPTETSPGLFESSYDLKAEMPLLIAASTTAVIEQQQRPPPLVSLSGGGCVIKTEDPERGGEEDLFPSPEDSNSASDAAMRELLDEKDRMDIASFISEYNDEVYAKQKCGGLLEAVTNSPAAAMTSSMKTAEEREEEEEAEMEKIFVDAIKEEEPLTISRPSTPPPAIVVDQAAKDVIVFDGPADPQERAITTAITGPPRRGSAGIGYTCTATVAPAPVPRPIFIRTQSQDSLTRTKNPVLPSIHAEQLVVPEPRLARYQQNPDPPFSLEDFEEVEEATATATTAASVVAPQQQHQLTELKGSLFLSDDYNQSYFQPWN
jgi:hypothetical protein